MKNKIVKMRNLGYRKEEGIISITKQNNTGDSRLEADYEGVKRQPHPRLINFEIAKPHLKDMLVFILILNNFSSCHVLK